MKPVSLQENLEKGIFVISTFMAMKVGLMINARSINEMPYTQKSLSQELRCSFHEAGAILHMMKTRGFVRFQRQHGVYFYLPTKELQDFLKTNMSILKLDEWVHRYGSELVIVEAVDYNQLKEEDI